MHASRDASLVSSPAIRGSRPGVARRIAIGVVVLLALYVAASGAALFVARHDLMAGANQLRALNVAVGGAHMAGNPGAETDRLIAGARTAQAHFRRARTLVRFAAPVTLALGWLPKYGPELRDAFPLSAAADDMDQGLLDLLHGVRPAAAALSSRGSASASHLPAALRSLASQRPTFARACRSFGDVVRDRRGVVATSGTVGTASRTIDRYLPRLQLACQGLQLLPAVLGVPRTRRYLVAYQDNLELRSTGGFIGSLGVVTVHDGTIHQHFQGVWPLFKNFSVPPPEPVQLYNGEPAWLVADANWSPNFPTSAQLESFFYHLNTGQSIGSVIDITPAAASAALTATGPLYLQEYHRTVDAANVAQLADYYTHYAASARALGGINQDTQRKRFLNVLAQHIFHRLPRLSASQWLKFASAMRGAIRRRDLLLYSPDSRIERLYKDLGADGRLLPARGDYLYVVDTNLSYNKINPYVHETVSYHASVRSDRWLNAQLSIRLTNSTPNTYTQGIGPGAGTLGKERDYADYLRVFVPDGSQLIDQSGWYQSWLPGPAYGKEMFCGYVIVRQGETRTITLKYVVPPNIFVASRGRRYTLALQHQPGSHPDAITISVDGAEVHPMTRILVKPDVDHSFTTPISALPVRPIPLSRQTPPIVEPGHWIEPHAFLSKPYRLHRP